MIVTVGGRLLRTATDMSAERSPAAGGRVVRLRRPGHDLRWSSSSVVTLA
jgi:hypothetical protein